MSLLTTRELARMCSIFVGKPFLGSIIAGLAVSLAIGCGSAAPVEQTTPTPLPGPSAHSRSSDHSRAKVESASRTCSLESVHFAFDSAELDDGAKHRLTESYRCLAALPRAHADVVGMADPRGTEEYNLALGDRRAQTTARYLKALGLGDRVSATSVGEEYATGTDEKGWANDRRAELKRK